MFQWHEEVQQESKEVKCAMLEDMIEVEFMNRHGDRETLTAAEIRDFIRELCQDLRDEREL